MSPGGRSPDLNEHSPLIVAQETGSDVDIDVEAEPLNRTPTLENAVLQSKSSLYLILLTFSIGGLQIVWSVELSNGSPYLLSLGMSKALVAFVWLAGPLTGVLVQPYIGIVSDRSRISWGKRKPFMIAGAGGVVVSSLLLAYAKDIVRVTGRWSIEDNYAGWWMGLTITLATILMWCLDFAINTVQAAIRAFIVDNAPAHQQESANAWASRITGVGNVLGYIFGYLNLPKYFHFFGNTQFKVLCTIASIAISFTVLVSSLAIKERNPQFDPPTKSDYEATGLLAFFKQIFASIKRLTPTVRSVCEIQFFHWIGWFPLLFYATTYIGQLYVNPRLRPDMTDAEVEALWAKATRVGTLALLIQAVVCLVGNMMLPFLIEPAFKKSTAEDMNMPGNSSSGVRTRNRSAAESTTVGGGTSSAISRSQSRGGRSFPNTKERNLSKIEYQLAKLQISGLTLRKMWFCGQVLHALCMFSTFFIATPTAGTVMIAVMGLSWAVTLWAPFALISADVARRDEERRLRLEKKGASAGRSRISRPTEDQSEAAEGLISSSATFGAANARTADEDEDHNVDQIGKPDAQSRAFRAGAPGDSEEPDRAGVILGLHNVAVSAPQILATLICSLIFKALQKGRGVPGDVSVAWTLRLSGIAALVAAWFTWRMKETAR